MSLERAVELAAFAQVGPAYESRGREASVGKLSRREQPAQPQPNPPQLLESIHSLAKALYRLFARTRAAVLSTHIGKARVQRADAFERRVLGC